MNLPGVPILSSEEAASFENRLFAHESGLEWAAMQRAGNALADAVVRDFEEIGGFPENGTILVLVGKGHNGGDALIAAQALLEKFPEASAAVLLVFGERALRTLTQKAYQALTRAAARRISAVSVQLPGAGYDLALDGVFGFQFRPPATPAVIQLAARVNALPIRLRAAVDLPSGGLFQADFTYATGIVKTPLLGDAAAGRPRFLDLQFFQGSETGEQRVLLPEILAPLSALRAPGTDKRSFGHVAVIGGSRHFPGAVLMTVLAALRSGVGLVTAFVPESLAPAFAARAPEAMWVGCPETPEGNLALEGQALVKARLERATALVAGPGLGHEPETLALLTQVVKMARVPVLLDADALQAEIVRAANVPVVLTPHAGEFARIADNTDLKEFAAASGATVVLKGPVTRICGRIAGPAPVDQELSPPPSDGAAETLTFHSFFGGPVLARGGSGDLLAGLIGGLLAQAPAEPLLAACRGVVWHGLAADCLARAHGQTTVQVTQLLEFLLPALRTAPKVE
jgi:hydroxyethylthiazole kinase-like uncharacterized protein yjeF